MSRNGKYIKRSRNVRLVGFSAAALLAIYLLLAVFPICYKDKDAEATVVPSTTTLSIVSSKDTASVEITPTSGAGTFATSVAADKAEFTVTTDNLTGYSLNLVGSDTSGQLVNATTGDTLDTLTADVSETTFRTGAAETYANKWGYQLNVNSTTTTNFLAAPTTGTKTIYTTTGPNTSADNYTLGVGARVDYSKAEGTYTNTFVLTAVGNPISYQINYLDNTGEGGTTGEDVSDLPTAEGSANITASSFTLATGEPSRTGYNFVGWCYGTVNHNDDPSSCDGTTYQPGDTFTFTSIPSTGTATANLYAMWESAGNIMQNLDPATCTSTPKTVVDSRDGQEYVVQRLADGNCWMMTNLNLGDTTNHPLTVANLDSSNTNFTGTISADTFNSWKKSSGTGTYTVAELIPLSGTDSTSQTPYGTLYNYCAASAGTICTDSNSSNATSDICPAGWRLPTGGSSGEFQTLYNNTAYNTNAKMRGPYTSNGAAFARTGAFASGVPADQGSFGTYWSSTVYTGGMNMYDLYLNSSNSVLPASNDNRTTGRSVRCILDAYPTMQDTSSSQLGALVPNTGDTITLEDSRDGSKYKVGRLADGNVWLLENLRLDLTDSNVQANLSSSTTNASDTSLSYLMNGGGSAPYPVNAISTSWASQLYENPLINVSYKDTTQAAVSPAPAGKVGAYYTYCALSAGSYCYTSSNDSGGDATEDICPKGWRLPTGGTSGEFQNLYTAYNSNTSNLLVGLNVPLTGYFSGGTRSNGGEESYYPTSTKKDATTMRGPALNKSTIYPQYDGISRHIGYTVRCIKDDSDLPEMQNITAAQLGTLIPNIGDTTLLKDSRDGSTYKVGRLADGNVWLLENLRLDLTDSSVKANLTSSTTNATDAHLTDLKNNVSTSTTTYTDPRINTSYKDTTQSASGNAQAGKIGVYYNFCAASAGSYCYASGSGSGNATEDVCPKGWRMPTGGSSGEYQALYMAYNTNAPNFMHYLNVSLTGRMQSTSVGDRGTYGFFWSSTSSGDVMYNIYTTSNGAPDTTDTSVRTQSFSVRCIWNDTRTLSDITNMQDINPNIVANTTTGTTKTLKDTRDNQEYTVGKLADGKLWMITNLNLGDITNHPLTVENLDSSNTNITSTVSATTFNTWKKSSGLSTYTAAQLIPISGTDPTSQTPYGTLYNYCAASAGTICTSSNSSDAASDICPKGWRLPTGGSSGEFQTLYDQSAYNTPAKMHAPYTSGGAAFAFAGFFSGGTPTDQGSYGSYWSSTRYSGGIMYQLSVSASNVEQAKDYNRGSGLSIRCIAK